MTGKYEWYFKSGVAEDMCRKLEAAAGSPELLDADDCYWLGKCLHACNSPVSSSLSIYCLARAFELGLTYSSDENRYVDASLLISRLYIKTGQYLLASNHLKTLIDSMSSPPDTITLYFLISEIMSDHVFYVAENPVFFFKRLDSISPENYENREKVYSIFLKRLRDLEWAHEEYKVLNYGKYYSLRMNYAANPSQDSFTATLPRSKNPVYAELDKLYAETRSFGFSEKHIVVKEKKQKEEVPYYTTTPYDGGY